MDKKELCHHYLKIRESIGEERRRQAHDNLVDSLMPLLKKTEGPVLSFASFGSEIDTNPVNQYLLSEKRLVLPRVVGEALHLYLVSDLDAHLSVSNWGVQEPDPKQCLPISGEEIALVLVPAIAFDTSYHRLGYGKGHFDRLLSVSVKAHTCGVGFAEQLADGPLPAEPHDVPLKQLLLV